MNSSAKITFATLLAASALGVAVISACTVTSTTNNDTDGGLSSSTSSSSGSTTSSSGSTTSSSGSSGSTSSGGTACTTSKQDAGVKFRNAACQTCLEQKCCDKLTACFNVPETATNIDCNDYHNCIESAPEADGGAESEAAQQAAYDLCDTAANDAIVTAYDSIAQCGNANCQAECQ